jgi:hypothetical protein
VQHLAAHFQICSEAADSVIDSDFFVEVHLREGIVWIALLQMKCQAAWQV